MSPRDYFVRSFWLTSVILLAISFCVVFAHQALAFEDADEDDGWITAADNPFRDWDGLPDDEQADPQTIGESVTIGASGGDLAAIRRDIDFLTWGVLPTGIGVYIAFVVAKWIFHIFNMR